MVHVRASRTKAERDGALAELVKRRRDAARRGSSRHSVDKIDLPAANVSNSNLTSSNEEESSWDDMSSSDEDNKSPEQPTLHEVMGITVPRSKLIQWYMEPFFNELIAGCFVLILIGKGKVEVPVYRLCQVLNVDATNPDRQYEFKNRTTCKYLNLLWGSGTPARWQMAVASNSPPSKVEFDQWLREVKLTGGRMPTKQELLEKRQALEKVESFVYSAATVRQMVEEKRSAGWKPANIVDKKDSLRRELELARDDDMQELKRIRARMHELETIRESSCGSRKKAMDSTWKLFHSKFQCLHDFDVSVPLDKVGGARGAKAGYMARKQHIEASVGVKVADYDDGRNHPHTLTVSEYMKRRGLI